jgi:hypothetical protein
MRKSYTPTAPRAGAATAAPASQPVLVRGGERDARRRKFNDLPIPKPIPDPISAALGETIFAQGARFDWCADAVGIRPQFKRCYPRIRVLVDEFGYVNEMVRREVALKAAALEKYNAAHKDAEYGYIPYVTGVAMDKDSVEFAKLGGIVPLVEPRVA